MILSEKDQLIPISSGVYEEQVHDVARPKRCSERRLNIALLLFVALAALVLVMTHRVGGQVSPASAAQSTVTQPFFEVVNKAKGGKDPKAEGGKAPKAEGGKAKGGMKNAKGSTTTTPPPTTTTYVPPTTTAAANDGDHCHIIVWIIMAASVTVASLSHHSIS
eukprot:g62845.t1